MLISIGREASDATPQRIETTWPEFVEWIYQHPRTPAKLSVAEYTHLKTFPSKSPEGRRIHADKTGPYVVLADFGGNRRAYDTLLHSSGVPLDFDTGRVGPETIRATLSGYRFVAFTTYAHQSEAERWRVFVPVSRPMSAAEHDATWTHLSGLFQNQADIAAKDATRLSYLPGSCLLPAEALCFHSDGAFFQPIPATQPAPVAGLQPSDGPVPGWAGPTDDVELLTIACNTRVKVAERFGGPIHFAMLWGGNTEWLAKNFPSNDGAQPWDYTRADAALASELAYWTGGDKERSADLMRRSGINRDHDDDWSERKVYLAFAKGMEGRSPTQFHFMGKAGAAAPPEAPDPPPAGLTVNLALDGTVTPPVDPLADIKNIPADVVGNVSMNDFFAFMPDHTYIHRPSGKRMSAASIDEAIGKEARQVLVPTVPVHSLTWAPGYPERFTMDLLDDTYREGNRVWLFNEYRPPKVHDTQGDPAPWLALLRKLYPDDAEHIINYFADAVQSPQHKCNHALVLGSGVHGIGKDTLVAPLQYAVGSQNFTAIKPTALTGDFNPYVRNVVVQISESHDLGEGHNKLSRYDMYERCKDLAAAPPTSLECNEKHKGQYPVANILRLIITTNHQVDGLFMDPADRRHYCAWSDALKMTEEESAAIWGWYAQGGLKIVSNYLATLDLAARGWSRTRAPQRTQWWHQLVAGGQVADDGKFDDALDRLKRPEWTTLGAITEGDVALAGWTMHPSNLRKIEREMVKAGYQRLPNPNEPKKGRWHMNGARVVVYRRSDIPAAQLLRQFGA